MKENVIYKTKKIKTQFIYFCIENISQRTNSRKFFEFDCRKTLFEHNFILKARITLIFVALNFFYLTL